jgi:hypothetical protein
MQLAGPFHQETEPVGAVTLTICLAYWPLIDGIRPQVLIGLGLPAALGELAGQCRPPLPLGTARRGGE